MCAFVATALANLLLARTRLAAQARLRVKRFSARESQPNGCGVKAGMYMAAGELKPAPTPFMTRLVEACLSPSDCPRESLADDAVAQHQHVQPRGVGGEQCVGQTAHAGFTLRVETALAAKLVEGLGATGA